MHRNYYAAMAAIALAGFAFQASAKGPRGRMLRKYGRPGRVEFKDDEGDQAAVLAEIKGGIAAVGDRLTKLEAGSPEVKSLDDQVKQLTTDLVDARKLLTGDGEGGERKSLDDRFTILTDAIAGVERKINEAVVNADGSKGDEKVATFAECKSLDDAMRAGQEVELKSIDTGLKVQDVFLDVPIGEDFPLLDAAHKLYTKSDAPNYGYNVGATAQHKGESSEVANVKKKVAITVLDYEYQPTLDRSDVQDMGSALLDDEALEAVEAIRELLNADLFDAIEAALVAQASITDVYTEIALYETDAEDTIDDDDLNQLEAALAKRYRRSAVYVANAAMRVKLENIRDATSGVSMWRPSLAQGVPAMLKGRPFFEDENVTGDRLILTSPRRGMAVAERERPTLSNIERDGGDYLPYFAGRYGAAVTDARATVVLDILNDVT